LKIDSVDQKCGNFSQDAGTPGTERVIAFSQLAVKGLKRLVPIYTIPTSRGVDKLFKTLAKLASS
jgi:hypothetical protein